MLILPEPLYELFQTIMHLKTAIVCRGTNKAPKNSANRLPDRDE
jgi:hypothetical protein